MKPNSTWYANSQRIRILMMSVISGHEMCLKYANVVLRVLGVACIDGCFVYNVLTHALVCSGHARMFLQSVLMFCDRLFLIMRVVWLVIIELTLLM